MPSKYDPGYLDALQETSEKEEKEFNARKQDEYDQMVGDKPEVPEGETEAPQTYNPLEGVQQAIPNAIQNVVQGAANLIGQGQAYQQRVEEGRQIAEERDKALEEAAYSNPLGAFAAETLRVPVDAAAGVIESTVDTVDLMGDLARVGFDKVRGVKTKPTEDPFSDRYVAAATDLGFQGPKTQVGQFASNILQFALVTRAVATRLPKVLIQLGTKGVGLKGAVASGLVPGAVADFILTDKDDGNFSSMVNNFIPEDNFLHDSFVFALRTEEQDDVFTAKLKSVVEGGLVGAAADALLWLMWGRKAGQKALSEGATQEEALAAGLEATAAKKAEVDKYNTKALLEEQQRFDSYNSEELQELMGLRTRYESQLAAYRNAGLEGTEKFNGLVEALQMVDDNIAQVGEALGRGYKPDDIKGIKQQDNAAYNKPAEPQLAVRQHLESDMPPEGVKVGDSYDYVKPDSGSYHMMTDAQMRKVEGYSPEAEDIIRKYSDELDLQELARQMKRPIGDIIAHAARKMDDFRSALANDIPASNLEDMMNNYELLNAKSIKGSKLLSKEGILVTKSLIGQQAEQIHSLAQNAIQLRAAGEPIGNQLDRAVDRLVTLLEYHKVTAYEAGSNLATFKRSVDDLVLTGEGTKNIDLTMKEVKEWATNVKSLLRKGDAAAEDEMMRLVNAMLLAGGDPTKQVKFWHAFFYNNGKNFTNSLYQSILSGPITHLRNAMGNTYSIIERPFSTYLTGVFSGDKEIKASAVAGAQAMFTGLGDAFKIAKITYNKGVSANFNAQFALEDMQTMAMIKQLEAAATTKKEKLGARWLAAHYRFLNNPWVSWPSRALMASDDFFKSLAARYRVYSKAKYESLMHSPAGADPKEQLDLFVKKFSKGIDPGTGRILDTDLLNYAERATFQQDPGSFINSLGRVVDTVPYGMGRLFMPFLRTPGNLFGYGLEHLPGIAPLVRKFDDTYKQAVKNNDRLLMAEIEGRHSTGLMLTGAMVTTALMTDVTGNYPANPKERAAWISEGRPPFAIKVGNKWVSYKGVEPVNSFLSIVADVVQLGKMGYADFGERVINQLGYSIALSYTDKSFLGGLADLGAIFNPQNLSNPNAMKFALQTLNNYTPYAGARRAFSNIIDPQLRAVRGEVDKMMATAMPGYKGALHAETSFITGEPRSSNSGGLYNAISPIGITDVNSSFVEKELTEINYASNKVVLTGEYGVELEPRHQTALAKIMHSLGVEQRLKDYMKTDEYKKFKKLYKERSFDFQDFVDGDSRDLPPHIRKVHQIISQAKKTALARMRKNDRSYLLLVAAEAYQRVNGDIGNYQKPSDDQLEAFLQYGNY